MELKVRKNELIGLGATMLSNPLAKDRRLTALRKGRVLIEKTWESQLDLSLFLGLLVLTVLLMPALGLERTSGRLGRDLVFSVVLISGLAIGWGRPPLFVFSSCVAMVALIIRWAALYIRTD